MSGFAVLFSRAGGPPEQASVAPLLDALAHRGPDGSKIVTLPGAVLGHQHLWVTPEEVGEQQPLVDSEHGLTLVLDGFVDNRSELAHELGIPPGQLSGTSDAAVLLRAYERWGREAFTRVIGSFAVVVHDCRAQQLVCVRDAIGDRILFYWVDDALAVVASEERALLAHPRVSARVNHDSLARFVALRAPATGATFFEDVKAVPEAHGLTIGRERLHLWRHWHPPDLPRLSYRRDEDYVEHFREVLTAAVRCRLRCRTRTSVLMSGGLDSTSVAALAAAELASREEAARLATISWVFSTTAGADERQFITPMIEQYHLDAALIPGDECWPLHEATSWVCNVNSPHEGLLRLLWDKAFTTARQQGAVVLLNGVFGDQLLSGSLFWLRDAVAHTRIDLALRQLWAELRNTDLSPRRRLIRLRGALRRCLTSDSRQSSPPPWLTPYAQDLLSSPDKGTGTGLKHLRPEQVCSVLDPLSSWTTAQSVTASSRYGIEVRHPYRDRRLIELALRLPAHLFTRSGSSKWLLRTALGSRLPEVVRNRRLRTSMFGLSRTGLVEKQRHMVHRILFDNDPSWPTYVRFDWLCSGYPEILTRDGAALIVAWKCLCLELWRSRIQDL